METQNKTYLEAEISAKVKKVLPHKTLFQHQRKILFLHVKFAKTQGFL